MFADIFDSFREPTPDQFDAYFYDVDRPCKDFSILPDFLQELVQYPIAGSGTNKFLWLIYKFACRARLAIECGVWEGNVTVPMAMGLKQNGGLLVSIDIDLTRPALKEKIDRNNIQNVNFLQMSDLNFKLEGHRESFDIVYIDSLHDYEHVVKQLFLYDEYLKKGGVFILHDIVAYSGVGLVDSYEDSGYENFAEYIHVMKTGSGKRHISEYPVLVPKENCLFSPIYLAVQTFLAYRKHYKLYKILDTCGMAFIWKQ